MHIKHLLITFAAVGLTACTGSNPNIIVKKDKDDEIKKFDPKVVYGTDDRRDIYEVSDMFLLNLADSTVALVQDNKLQSLGNGVSNIKTNKFGEYYNLCEEEPYHDQPVGAFCSGFLVAEDIIVTAGHCVTSQAACKTTKFVFGFHVAEAGVAPQMVDSAEVYSCDKLIHSQAVNADYAVIKLDRPVEGHMPLALRMEGTPAQGDSLVVMGHPAGLPLKIADNAAVRSVNNEFLVANLDTYGGNSGSAVFSSETGEVEGILVRGATDFVFEGDCRITNYCADDACRGEDVTRISQVLAHLIEPEPVVYELMEQVAADTDIPDNDANGITSSLELNEMANGRKVHVMMDIEHTWQNDLIVSVIDPAGNEIVLHSRTGGGTDDIVGTFGSDLVSKGSLDSLSNSPEGTWTLKVIDAASRDVGVLNKWGIGFVQ